MHPRRLHSIEPTNLAMVYRTCRECLMEVSWPMKQSSLSECPYCDTPYQRPTRRQLIKGAAKQAGATVLVFLGVIGIVGLLVRIGSRLFL
jgi:uncharacterized paraquat-inducible protein A